MTSVFYVADYLTAEKTDSEAIADCLADAAKCPSRTIVFDRKDYTVGEAILLSAHTTVILDDCTVMLADETADNIFRGSNVIPDPDDPYGMPLACEPISDIKILGKGNAKISGPAKNKIGYHPVLQEEQPMVGDFWGWRTHLISLSRCTDFEIGGFSVSGARGWAICFDLCRNGHIHDIHFQTDVKNGDGIDFRSGCHKCLVEHIRGTTSDDTVACTALTKKRETFPMKNYLYPHEPGDCLRDRTDEDCDISDITIRDVETNGKHHAVICLAANGCRVHHIQIEHIREPFLHDRRECVVKIYTGYGSGYTKGDLHHISVRDVHASYANHTVYCNAEVMDVALERITHPNPAKAMKLDHPEGITVTCS